MWAGITGTTSRPVGGKFAVACYDGDRLCGVAICGRPVGRYLYDGLTLEILHCCTDGQVTPAPNFIHLQVCPHNYQ